MLGVVFFIVCMCHGLSQDSFGIKPFFFSPTSLCQRHFGVFSYHVHEICKDLLNCFLDRGARSMFRGTIEGYALSF